MKNYYQNNRSRELEKSKEYYKNNRKIKEENRVIAFNILGGCKCTMCEESRINRLTIDHIDEMGFLDRERDLKGWRMTNAIAAGNLTQNELKNLRVLCWNHNLGRNRKYVDLSHEERTSDQKYKVKIYEEAFNFFGPCSCGQSNIKFLSISHIHNNGAERRREGEKTAAALLSKFRIQGWPQSLKEDFRLECFNCNCSCGNQIGPSAMRK
jgi:hypothetical protein